MYVRYEVLMVMTMKPTLKTEAAGSFETMVWIYKITQWDLLASYYFWYIHILVKRNFSLFAEPLTWYIWLGEVDQIRGKNLWNAPNLGADYLKTATQHRILGHVSFFSKRGLLWRLPHWYWPTSCCLYYGHAVCLGERCIEEDVSTCENAVHLRVL